MNKAFNETKLEKRPQTVPIQHIPSPDDYMNSLNIDERRVVSQVLQKLSRYHDNKSNMKTFFEDQAAFSGTVTQHGLQKVLTVCGLIELVAPQELDVLFKCFSTQAGYSRKFDYKHFLMVLSRISDM